MVNLVFIFVLYNVEIQLKFKKRIFIDLFIAFRFDNKTFKTNAVCNHLHTQSFTSI